MDDRRAEILLVEDDDNDVAVALRALSRQSLDRHVRVMRDGAELLDYVFQRHPRAMPKAILLDLKMPRLDGRSALRELRKNPQTRHIPVVIVSSSERESAWSIMERAVRRLLWPRGRTALPILIPSRGRSSSGH